VLALIVFFILAICISTGGVGPRTIGFTYWHDPGAFADSINGVAKTFVVAGTLYAGTEMWVSSVLQKRSIRFEADDGLGLASLLESLRTLRKQSRRQSSRSFGVS
jgi:hypothetical protein